MRLRLRKWILMSVLFSMLVGCGGPWSSGDRVLVSKCAYDAGIGSPHRYDVVVFKYPLGPMDNNTPKNYIKRLLGLPGELIAIFFGRLYRWVPGPNDSPPFDDINGGKVNPDHLHLHAWMHKDEPPVHDWFEEGRDARTGKERRFEILRKPPHVMMALRRIVYDNDYQAKDLKGKLDRWTPSKESGWKVENETGFVHDSKTADRVDWLRYQHLLAPENRIIFGDIREKTKPRLILDTMDYNSFDTVAPDGRDRPRTPSHPHWVGDLMIECNVEIVDPRGEFWFELSRGIHRYRACWDLASGKCTLFRIGKEGQNETSEVLAVRETTRVKGAGNHLLRFANIDARLTVWVDSELPFGDGHEYEPLDIRGPKDKKGLTLKDIEDRRGPRPENDLEPASIGSKGAHVKITHLRLWRDTYYTTQGNGPDYDLPDPRLLDTEFWTSPATWSPDRKNRFHDAMKHKLTADAMQEWEKKDWEEKGWEPLHRQKYATMFVQPGHYLCLGDNSQQSADSREWGLVPQRLMLGRALMVYFPLDRVGPIR